MNREHLKFKTIREDLNEYEVENGQILKMKMTVTDIIAQQTESGQINASLRLKDISEVITDPPIDTTNFEYAEISQVTEKDEFKQLNFKPISEIINIYETAKFIFLVESRVKSISLTNKKDKDNNPILRYSHETNLAILDKKNISSPQPTQ